MKSRHAATMALLAVASPMALYASDGRADEPKLNPYTVVEGDACDTVARKVLGDARLFEVLHKYNPQLGPSPHHLKAGQVLMLPAPSPDARLELIRNRVEVQSRPGELHQPLYRGNRLSTGQASAADMKFRDETELALGEQSLVIILGATSAGVRQDSEATLVNGSLRAHLADLAGHAGAPVVVSTTSAQVKLGPGDVQVGVDDKSATRLAVYKGRSSLVAQESTIRVAEGFGSKAERGRAPTLPRPLPPAPVWKSPPPPLSIVALGLVDLSADYARGPGNGPDAAEWHVQVARDVAFHDVVVDTKVPGATTRIEAKQNDAGVVFARVSAIDDDHFEGPWSPGARMVVTRVNVSDQPNHYGQVDVPGDGILCGLDDAKPVAKASFPFDRSAPHTLNCVLADATDVKATAPLPADAIGPLVMRAHWLSLDPALREGEMVLELADGRGDPFSRADATVVATSHGSTVTHVEPGFEAGRYFVKTRWEAGTTSVQYRLTLHGLGVNAAAAIPVTAVVHP